MPVITLAEVAARLEVLTIACGRCDRRGRLRVYPLLVQHGGHAPMPAVLRALVGDCPHRDGQERGRCDPHALELAQAFTAPDLEGQ